MNDILIIHLLEIQKALNKVGVEFVLGGGMSLYLRLVNLENSSPRYPLISEIRSTDDLDVFLSSSVVVDFEKMNQLKSVIKNLGYEPSEDALYFQFIKKVKIYESDHAIKIDLLASPPKEKDESLVHIKPPRIRPKKCEEIHAYLTEEARNLI